MERSPRASLQLLTSSKRDEPARGNRHAPVLVEAYALLGGLDALRHLLLLGDLGRLGAGHLVEFAADASFIVWMHASEMGELPLDDFMLHMASATLR